MGSMAEVARTTLRPLELPVSTLKEAVPFYEKLFPNDLLRAELEAETRAAEVAGASDAAKAILSEITAELADPSQKRERRYVRKLFSVLRPDGEQMCKSAPLSPEDADHLVRKDVARVRRTLVAAWLTILYEGCSLETWSLGLDDALLPPYTSNDGGSWKNAIVSRPSIHVLRREACGRVFDAFVAKVKTLLQEEKRLPLFSEPRASLRQMPNGPALYFG